MNQPLDYALPGTPSGGRSSDVLFVTEHVSLPACPRVVRSRARVRLTDGRDTPSQLAEIGGVAVLLAITVAIIALAGRIGACGIAGLTILSTFALLLMIPATAAASRRREGVPIDFLSYDRAAGLIELPIARCGIARQDLRRVECLTVGGLADFESEIQLIAANGADAERRIGIVRAGFAMRGVAASLARAFGVPSRDVIFRSWDRSPTVSDYDAGGTRSPRTSVESST